MDSRTIDLGLIYCFLQFRLHNDLPKRPSVVL